MMQAAICVGVADVRREPDAASELVTQALLGAQAQPRQAPAAEGWASAFSPAARAPAPGPLCDGWQQVQLVDYAGWVRAEHLATPPSDDGSAEILVVTALAAPLIRSKAPAETPPDTLFCSTVLPGALSSMSMLHTVALPGGDIGWLRPSDVEVRPAAQPFPRRDAAFVIETARRFLGTPYLWGGTTSLGIDCSGFAQLCYRLAGYTLPRDARQQYAALSTEPEGDPEPGDLLFFAKEGRVVHVAISLGQGELIHAEGVTWNKVIHQSMNPRHADRYNHRLVELYCGARRVIGVGAAL